MSIITSSLHNVCSGRTLVHICIYTLVMKVNMCSVQAAYNLAGNYGLMFQVNGIRYMPEIMPREISELVLRLAYLYAESAVNM